MSWVSVKDRLPKVGERVLICRKKNGALYVEQATVSVNGWWRVYGTNVRRVYYWQPLPEPPKNGDGNGADEVL